MGDTSLDSQPAHARAEGIPDPPSEKRYRKRSKTSESVTDRTDDPSSSSTAPKLRKMVELVYTVDQKDIKEFSKSPQKFITQRNTKRAVEVNLKDLTEEDLEEME